MEQILFALVLLLSLALVVAIVHDFDRRGII
jgi:hypothetical protein